MSRRSSRSRFTPCPVTVPVKSHRLAVANDNVVLKLAREDVGAPPAMIESLVYADMRPNDGTG